MLFRCEKKTIILTATSVLLHSIIIFVISGCTKNSDLSHNPVSVMRLNADSETVFSSRITESVPVNTQQEVSILNLDLLHKSGWYKIHVHIPEGVTDCFLDMGPMPLGIRVLAVPSRTYRNKWETVSGDDLPGRFIGPLVAMNDGSATVFIQMYSPTSVKTIVKCITHDEIRKTLISENYFRITLVTLIALFIIQFLFFFSMSRDLIYLNLIGHHIFFIGYFLFISGTYYILPVKLPEYHLLYISISLGLYLLNSIIQRLFHLRQRSAILNRVINFVKIILILQLILFFVFPGEMFTSYYISSLLNRIILASVSIFIIRIGAVYEKILGLIVLISQILMIFITVYLSGFFYILLPYAGARPELFHFIHFSGMIVMIILIAGLFFGALSARYSALYNQMQIVEDDGRRLPQEIVNLRIARAADKNSSLISFTEEDIRQINQKIDALFINERIYRESELDLNGLAERLNIQPWRLSIFLNNHRKKSFREFITHYRLDDVIRHLKEKPEYPILRIAFDAGFDSKTSFNRAFQKYKGMTPSEYRRKILL